MGRFIRSIRGYTVWFKIYLSSTWALVLCRVFDLLNIWLIMHIEALLILLMLHEARSLTIQECACSFVAFVLLQLWLHILTHILALWLINLQNFLVWTNIEIDRTFVLNILNVNSAWIDTLHPVAIFVNTLVDAYGIGSWHLFEHSYSLSAYLGGSNLTSG